MYQIRDCFATFCGLTRMISKAGAKMREGLAIFLDKMLLNNSVKSMILNSCVGLIRLSKMATNFLQVGTLSPYLVLLIIVVNLIMTQQLWRLMRRFVVSFIVLNPKKQRTIK